MNFNFKTLCAIGALMFGSVDAYFGICPDESLEVIGANQRDVAEFEDADLFENLKELKIDPNNVGVLIARFKGNGRPLEKDSFPKLKNLDILGSLTWKMIKQALKYLPTVSTLIIDPPNFADEEDADVAKYVQNYESDNRYIDEVFEIPACFVSIENERIVIKGELKKIEDYKDEIRKICWESGVSAKNTEVTRSMIESIRNGNKIEVQSLVKENPDVLLSKFEGMSMYERAIQFNQQDIAQFFVDLKDQQEEVVSKICKIVKKHRIVKKKNIVEKRNKLLRWASEKGNKELIELLLEIGADVNRTDKNGCTPLFYTKNVEVAEKLIAHGANVNYRNNDGFTWLTMAIRNPKKGRNSESQKLPLVKLILERIKKDKINEPTNIGNTALHIATRFDYEKIAKMLIEAGADLSIKNKEGMTPFMRAVQFDSEKIAKLCLTKYSQKEKEEALRYAIKNSSNKVGDMLLDTADFSREQLINVVRSTWNSRHSNSMPDFGRNPYWSDDWYSDSDSSDSDSDSSSSDSDSSSQASEQPNWHDDRYSDSDSSDSDSSVYTFD